MKQFIQDLANTHRFQATHLLHILRGVQSRYHYIPEQAIEQIADLLNITRTHIIGVVEFYSFFHLNAPWAIRTLYKRFHYRSHAGQAKPDRLFV